MTDQIINRLRLCAQRQLDVASRLPSTISLIQRAASGVLPDAQRDEASKSVDDLLSALFAQPGAEALEVPAKFWASPLGQMVAAAQTRLAGDEMITLSTLSAMLYGNSTEESLIRANRFVQRVGLIRMVDPAETNPQRAGRYSRRAVEELVAAGEPRKRKR